MACRLRRSLAAVIVWQLVFAGFKELLATPIASNVFKFPEPEQGWYKFSV